MRTRNAGLIVAALIALGGTGCVKSAVVSDPTTLAGPLADENATAVSNYLAKSSAAVQTASVDPAFANFLGGPGTLAERRLSDLGAQAGRALRQFDSYLPTAGEVCFIDQSGLELAKLVSSNRTAEEDLDADESGASFFGPTFALKPGEVHMSDPYVSGDTNDIVFSFSASMKGAEAGAALVHAEIPLAPLRSLLQRPVNSELEVELVDAHSGAVLLSTNRAVAFTDGATGPYRALKGRDLTGSFRIEGREISYQVVNLTGDGAARWFVVVGPTKA
jgi:hypothetical protein